MVFFKYPKFYFYKILTKGSEKKEGEISFYFLLVFHLQFFSITNNEIAFCNGEKIGQNVKNFF